MRKLCGVLTALVVGGSLLSAPLADEKADVAMVEREIKAVDESIAVHNRAMERARKAVDRSSLGRECQRAKDEAATAWENLKASRAHRDFLGKDKIKDRRSFASSIGENEHAQYQPWLAEKYFAEIDRRRKAYDKAVQKPKILSELADALGKRCKIFVKKMTRIFLTDEIKRAAEKKLDGLTRELKKIRKKDYANM